MVQDVHKLINSKEWYHVIEVAPGVKTPGRYDCAQWLDKMAFPNDLAGKTVLDIGTYDGFFAFEAERQGAKRVVAIDRCPPDHMGFAIAHQLLGSKVEYKIMSVYDLSPDILGTFDVVLFLGVLYHLRHPLLAIDKIHSVCSEYMFLETHALDEQFVYQGRGMTLKEINPILLNSPIMQFYPEDELGHDASNWFAPNIRCVEAMLTTSGFVPKLVGRFGWRASFVAKREEFVQPHWY
jgi:tRNA (mo5U34)-methyltransferase